MKTYLLSLFLFTISLANAQKGKTIIAVFAHPDDEGSVSAVLAVYASEGVNVYVVVATDGRLGVNKWSGIPAGDSLVSIRAREMQCAATALGINPPIMLGLHDQLDMDKGLAAQYAALDSLRNKVKELFDRLQPDIIITWGPSGWSGRPDHRLVGDVVTEVFQSMHWQKKVSLFYPEIPDGGLQKTGSGFATTNSLYLTIRVPVSAADLLKAKNAWMCHKSQYTVQEVENLVNAIWDKKRPIVYFRPFITPGMVQHSLFTNE